MRSEYVCDVVCRTDAGGAESAFCSAGGVVQFTRTAGTSQLVMTPFTNTVWPISPASGPNVQQPWQWLRSPPSQTASSLVEPAPNDAVLDARVLVLIARSIPVYAPAGYSGGYSGSGFQPARPMGTATVLNIGTPDWFLALVAAMFPTVRAMAWYGVRRRVKLASRAICANCGYDMRATPHRCPECGTRKR